MPFTKCAEEPKSGCQKHADFGEIRDRLEEVYQHVAQASGIRFVFDREDRQSHVNSHTFYLGYQGPLPNPNTVKVDINISETVLFPVEQKKILRAYEEFSDIPEGRAVAVYSTTNIKITLLDGFARLRERRLRIPLQRCASGTPQTSRSQRQRVSLSRGCSSERPRKASYAPSGGPDFKYRGPSLVPAASPSPGLEARMSSMRIPDDIQKMDS